MTPIGSGGKTPTRRCSLAFDYMCKLTMRLNDRAGEENRRDPARWYVTGKPKIMGFSDSRLPPLCLPRGSCRSFWQTDCRHSFRNDGVSMTSRSKWALRVADQKGRGMAKMMQERYFRTSFTPVPLKPISGESCSHLSLGSTWWLLLPTGRRRTWSRCRPPILVEEHSSRTGIRSIGM